MGKMILYSGTPDDDNREYLPEKIKGSDIVVNENGNNSNRLGPGHLHLLDAGGRNERLHRGLSRLLRAAGLAGEVGQLAL